MLRTILRKGSPYGIEKFVSKIPVVQNIVLSVTTGKEWENVISKEGDNTIKFF